MSGNDFTITEDGADAEVSRFVLEGRITSANVEILQDKLEDMAAAGRLHVVLDMRHVQFLSSGGIRVLLMFHRKFKALGGSFYVESPSDNVKNVLGMTALDGMLLKPWRKE